MRGPRLLGAEHDTEVGAAPMSPTRCYIVCSTQRSGSGLLCRGLTDAGSAGTPTEYFNAAVRDALTRRWGCARELPAYAGELRARRTTPAGLFGTKLHWDQLEQLRAEALGLGRAEPEFEISDRFLVSLLPAPTYVHVLRRDVNRQAVSFWTALQTGVWSAPATDGGDAEDHAPYTFEGIDRCRRLIENAEVHWDRFFRFNGVEPLEVIYEELDADYEGEIAALLARLLPDAAPVRLPPPWSRRMRDAHTDSLLHRYAEDREIRGLDDPLAPPTHAAEKVAELERELILLSSSRSWRLTRPLRSASMFARRAAERR